MNWKKIGKISLFVFLGVMLILGALYGYFYYQFRGKYEVNQEKYAHSIGYLGDSTGESTFKRCNNRRPYGWFASAATYGPIYKGSKSTFKKYVRENFTPVDSTENGFLNLRFVFNCHGEVGNMEINEVDENYKATTISPQLTKQLVELSSRKENWNVMEVDGEKLDSYMYLIYKIENGDVVEILP